MQIISQSQTFITKSTLTGRYGNFEAYTVQGNTYPIKEQLKNLGFNWMPSIKVWYIAANKLTSNTIEQLNRLNVSTTKLGQNVTTQPTQTTQAPLTQPTEPAKPTEPAEHTKPTTQPLGCD